MQNKVAKFCEGHVCVLFWFLDLGCSLLGILPLHDSSVGGLLGSVANTKPCLVMWLTICNQFLLVHTWQYVLWPPTVDLQLHFFHLLESGCLHVAFLVRKVWHIFLEHSAWTQNLHDLLHSKGSGSLIACACCDARGYGLWFLYKLWMPCACAKIMLSIYMFLMHLRDATSCIVPRHLVWHVV